MAGESEIQKQLEENRRRVQEDLDRQARELAEERRRENEREWLN